MFKYQLDISHKFLYVRVLRYSIAFFVYFSTFFACFWFLHYTILHSNAFLTLDYYVFFDCLRIQLLRLAIINPLIRWVGDLVFAQTTENQFVRKIVKNTEYWQFFPVWALFFTNSDKIDRKLSVFRKIVLISDIFCQFLEILPLFLTKQDFKGLRVFAYMLKCLVTRQDCVHRLTVREVKPSPPAERI